MTKDPTDTTENVPLWNSPESGIPFLLSAFSVIFAVGYALVLGYVLELTDIGEALTFVLYFGGLGAGIGFVAREYSISAGIGVIAFAIVPALYTWVGGWADWPQAVVSLSSAGGVAFGIFLISVGCETIFRWPKSFSSLLSARDTHVGILLGLFLTLVTFAVWSPPETVYQSVLMEVAQSLIIATRGLFLIASVLVPTLFITRKRVITPALLIGSLIFTAVFRDAGSTVWSVTAESFAEYGILFLVLVLGAGFIELSCKSLFARIKKMRLSGLSY